MWFSKQINWIMSGVQRLFFSTWFVSTKQDTNTHRKWNGNQLVFLRINFHFGTGCTGTVLVLLAIFISTLVHSFESFRFLYISLNGIQCLTKWILHFKNNDNFLMDDFWKDLTIVTTLFFLLPFKFDSKQHQNKKGWKCIIQIKKWKDVG